jgi:hypothetical protein
MAGETVDGGALLTIRTARTRHWCGLGRHWIEPGELYEDWRVPPGRADNESDHWWRGKRHAAADGQDFGRVCDEIDAYREHAARSALLPATAGEEAGDEKTST